MVKIAVWKHVGVCCQWLIVIGTGSWIIKSFGNSGKLYRNGGKQFINFEPHFGHSDSTTRGHFQASVAYKSVVYKKACTMMSPNKADRMIEGQSKKIKSQKNLS